MKAINPEMITVETGQGAFTGYLARAAAPAARVLLYHAWWGLTPVFKDLASRLAGEGFTVFAPDLYDGKTAGTIEEAEAMLEQRDRQRHGFIASAALEWLCAQPGAGDGVGLIGFSMGGGWALYLAGEYPQAVKAVVLVYATGDGDFSQMQTRFQAHFAGDDEWNPQDEVDFVEAGLRDNRVPYEFFTYPGAQHWFMESNRPEYRAADAELAWQRMVAFLRETLAA